MYGIEIRFPVDVTLAKQDLERLHKWLDAVCARYERAHPDRVMWCFGYGSKMPANPMMLSEDEPIPFDDSVYSIEIAERENYDWPCGKCGHPQGDHAWMIFDPPAGDCEYAPRQQENKVTDQFHPAPIEFEPEQIAADPILKFFHYAHLPPTLQERSAPFCKLAQHLVANLPRNAERTVALRKLLEAKDAAVRAAIPA